MRRATVRHWRGKPAIAVVVATVSRVARSVDAGGMTVTAFGARAHQGRRRRALWRLDPSGRHPRSSAQPEIEDFELCLALLDEAIARAERWIDCRERMLADFDVHAADTVRRLRIAGMVGPSTMWDSGDGAARRSVGIVAVARAPHAGRPGAGAAA
jgi:hypothetical protein